LEIGRASRKPHIYDINWRPAKPLVPRPLRHGVPERVTHDGQVLVPLNEDDARQALRELRDAGCTSVAVCLLHSYANPVHERRIGEIAEAEFPELDVSLSSSIVREFREYERVSTTSLNAYVKRPLQKHLSGLSAALKKRGVETPMIMRGNGGVSTFEVASLTPVGITHSGPMGGIIGGTAVAAACGISNIITLDMGGTSADVSLISNGDPMLTTHGKVGEYPILLPMLDLITIGAGGGSIAWVDAGGALRVGPRSAGARPGPACYGRGGVEPTVTDANLFAGRLNPKYFLSGQSQLDAVLAEKALREKIADPLGMDMGESAIGILSIAESHMVNAIKLISVDRGLDPRDFTLVGFGGAGPLHTLRLAEELGISRVLIPPAPGNLSSMGLLAADVRHDFALTRVTALDAVRLDTLAAGFQSLIEEAGIALDLEDVPKDRRLIVASVDLRYQGQNYELNLPIGAGALDEAGFAALGPRFHDEHDRAYGYRLADRGIQLVNLRVSAIGHVPNAGWPDIGTSDAMLKPIAERPVLLSWGVTANVPVYRVTDIHTDDAITGPAIVEYPGSTLFVPPGWEATCDRMRNLHLINAAPGNKTPGNKN
jgi:N-methylhydantoinase A